MLFPTMGTGPTFLSLFPAVASIYSSGPRDSEISYSLAHVFAASAAPATCFHTEVWAQGPNTPGQGPSVWKHFAAEAAKA